VQAGLLYDSERLGRFFGSSGRPRSLDEAVSCRECSRNVRARAQMASGSYVSGRQAVVASAPRPRYARMISTCGGQPTKSCRAASSRQTATEPTRRDRGSAQSHMPYAPSSSVHRAARARAAP
jgi:hypothetical protein